MKKILLIVSFLLACGVVAQAAITKIGSDHINFNSNTNMNGHDLSGVGSLTVTSCTGCGGGSATPSVAMNQPFYMNKATDTESLTYESGPPVHYFTFSDTLAEINGPSIIDILGSGGGCGSFNPLSGALVGCNSASNSNSGGLFYSNGTGYSVIISNNNSVASGALYINTAGTAPILIASNGSTPIASIDSLGNIGTIASFFGDGSHLTGITASDSSKVLKAGDTMSGTLNMGGNGISNIGIATASYFVGNGSHLTGVISTDSSKVPLAGGSMTGLLNITVAHGDALDLIGDVTIGEATPSQDGGHSFNIYGNYYANTANEFQWIASNDSFTSGFSNTITGGASSAIGAGNTVDGNYSNAFGYVTSASGLASFAANSNTTASGANSAALGNYSIASGDDSFTEGHANTAGPGVDAIAMGAYVKATAANSIVLGVGGPAPLTPYYLVNSIANSLMVGFDSDVPTFTVLAAAGTGTVGAIQLGCQATAPTTCASSADAGKEACDSSSGASTVVKCFCTGTAWVNETPGSCW